MGIVFGGAIQTRPARGGDAPLLARLANMAGDGLPSQLWAGMAGPGQDPFEIGAQRAARTEGDFSWSNARVATWHGSAIGAAIHYDIDATEPADPGADPLLRPLLNLEARASGTRYLNFLAVLPQARRHGAAINLLDEIVAGTSRDVSLIVGSENRGARALYISRGFEERDRERMAKDGPDGRRSDWILMTRRN